MRPQTVGKILGVGLRVAGRVAGQRLSGPGTEASAEAANPATDQANRVAGRKAGASAARVGGGVARGMGGFLRPFRRVGGIVFLEVTGAFFLLFVIMFGSWAWKLRADWMHGPEHGKFVLYVAVGLAFLYLGVSSFWRAKKK